MTTVRAVVILPGSSASVVEDFDTSLEAMQKFVGGYIETAHIGGNTVALLNEEGLLDGLPWNVWLKGCGSPFAGPVAILEDGVDGEFASLSEGKARFTVSLLNASRLMPTPPSLDACEAMTGRPAITITSF
jgi:hypothetical protein